MHGMPQLFVPHAGSWFVGRGKAVDLAALARSNDKEGISLFAQLSKIGREVELADEFRCLVIAVQIKPERAYETDSEPVRIEVANESLFLGGL